MSWAFRRMLQAFATFLVAVVLMFFLMRLAPGDPLSRLGDERPFSPAALAAIRARYGLDQPLLTQYRTYLTGLLRGDLGTSFRYNGPVTAQIRDKFPNTATLALAAMLLP